MQPKRSTSDNSKTASRDPAAVRAPHPDIWRLWAPLAYLSPRIIAAIVDGTAPADLTVTGLAKTLPYSWCEQERSIRL